jgi:hypothetical protein
MQMTYEVMIDENGMIHAENNAVLPKGKAILTFVQSPSMAGQLPKSDVSNLFGMLKATKGVSLEEMDEAIAEGIVERFNESVK